MGMNSAKAAVHGGWKTRLEGRRRELRKEIVAALEESAREDYAVIAGQVHDREDESLADLLVDVRNADIDRHVAEARDIEAALMRLAAGSYGVCTDCGAAIVPARLEAYPTAKRCRACQEKHERSRGIRPAASL
jgi:DnaK suppressor protein